jgi:hypothetical protein
MDKKQKESLVMALLEKGATYKEITKKAGVSPNTVKVIANKAGLSETTSESSRAFELYIQQNTPLEVAIELNIEADKAIHYYHEYFKLLGITEFTKAYLQVKDNPWPFVDLVKLVQNSRISDREVVELLKIANGHLPRVGYEYDRLKYELNSLKAETNNAVRTYQDFCDRNVELKKREGELQLSISELECKETRLNESLSEFQENDDFNLEVKEEEVISMLNVLTQQPNMAIDYHPTENNTLHYPPQGESSSRTLIFDTKDLFPKKVQT